jgi:hypothetical protein
MEYLTCPRCLRLEHPDEPRCRACGHELHADVVDPVNNGSRRPSSSPDRPDEFVDPTRLCAECGADVVGNDPHEPGCESDPDRERVIDGDEVCRILRERGIHAEVAQTGGGTATLYAGPTHKFEDEDDETMRGLDVYAVAAGPGWFDGPGWTRSKFSTAEFVVGHDHPYGEDAYENVPAASTAASVADLVVKYVRADAVRREAH